VSENLPEPHDDYEHLGPNMRARLNEAEIAIARVRDWVQLAAETSRTANLSAAYLCLTLGWARPRPWVDVRPGSEVAQHRMD
jgi:hypothetical protein